MDASRLTGWRRRALIWPAVFVTTPILLILSPALVMAALLVDLATGIRRRRALRLLGMTLNYLTLVMAGLLAGFMLWLATGLGLLVRTRWSQQAHHVVQMWWTRSVLSAVRRWLGATVQVDGDELLGPGPMVVLARHSSFFDAVLPSVVLSVHASGHVRHVLKRELQWEPCIDLFGNRMRNHFVDRSTSQTEREVARIRALAADLGQDAVVIFPEGTFRSARGAELILERFREREPDRAGRLQLRQLLPPRPGGLLALLEGAPDADVIILGHAGFEPFGSFRQIIGHVPFRRPVHVKIWRIPRAEIPDDPTLQLAFVDEWWQRLDDWVAAQSQTCSGSH